MQKPDATMGPRRSSRIGEIVARQKVKEAERVAKLEIESRAPKQPAKQNTARKRKRPGPKLSSTGSGLVAEADVGAEGDQSVESESPEKKQKTTPLQEEAGTELRSISADQKEQDTAPLMEKEASASVAEDEKTAPQQDEANAGFQDMPADEELQLTTTPRIEEQALVQQTVVNEDQDTAPRRDEAGAEGQVISANIKGQESAPLVEEQAVADQVVVNGDRDTTRQQVEATDKLEDISADREDRVTALLDEEQALAEEDTETIPQQDKASDKVGNMPTSREEEATTLNVEEQASVDEGQKFTKVLKTIILVRRQLRRKRAARRKCLEEKSELEWLLDYNWSQLANVPTEEKYPVVRDKLRADIERFERNLKQRMKDNADFRESYKYCRSLVHTVKGIEASLHDAEQEIEATLERYYNHAGQSLLEETARADLRVEFEEVKSHDQALRDISGPDSRRLELERDVLRTKKMSSAQNSTLATLAENEMAKRGLLQPCVPDGEETAADPEDAEQPKATEQAADEPSEADKLEAQRDAAKAELLSAQAHLCDAYKDFQERRNLTEEVFAQLPKSFTEDDIGLELQMKLIRTTRNYIEAQERVRLAQAESRRLDVPGVDKHPVGQTWDFEDRPDDGYAESAIADKVEKPKPRVAAWLSQLAMAGKPLPTSTRLQAPMKVSKKLARLAELRLGDDKAEDFSSDGAKERIARYQKACEDLRNSGQFPSAVPDRFISRERLCELDSHMI
ncbi:hypothetical protein Q7P35_004392 [Cladosporium inversicolor]